MSDGAGRVKYNRGDYNDRKGVTLEPLINEDVNSLSALHSIMRSFDYKELAISSAVLNLPMDQVIIQTW